MKLASKKGLQDSVGVLKDDAAAKLAVTNTKVASTPWHRDGTNVWEAWRSMYYLLLGDLFFFFTLCTIFFIFFLFIVDFDFAALVHVPQWQYSGLLFWLRTFYGLCAAPFLIFLLPFEGAFFVKVSNQTAFVQLAPLLCAMRLVAMDTCPCHSYTCPCHSYTCPCHSNT
jgi:hypothetical protein